MKTIPAKNHKFLKAPGVINLEITDMCNARCRHCYNFWREDTASLCSMSKESMDRILDIFIESGVFHIIFTGGEPFMNLKVLEFGLKKALENNISVSCNSNLMLTTKDNVKKLRDIGLDHILTSLNSHDPATNDYIVNVKGAFKKIITGIENAVKCGIRVSVNMIVSQINKEHVYATGRLAHDLGCQKIFGTRVVPSVNVKDIDESAFKLEKENALNTLRQLVRVKEATGIMIGTLVAYPLCLLSDLEKYKDFVGRGCPGQSRYLMSVNANGDTHACVHQKDGYGNIFEEGIYEPYNRMRAWHDESYRYKGCEGCDYIDICRTGCRMSAHGYFGKYDERDPLMTGKDSFVKPYRIVYDESVYGKIDGGLKFVAPKRLRFRKENGFHLVNIRWANTIAVDDETARFLIKNRDSGKEFDINDFGRDKREILARLFFKDVIESRYAAYDDLRDKVGLSVNPFDLK